jgi:beta-mannosidase
MGAIYQLAIVLVLISATMSFAQQDDQGLLTIGGFRCVDLKSLKNDSSYDLYEIGYFCYASFRMDVWKRHGVPFWYPRETGNIRVAGGRWRPSTVSLVSAARMGGIAEADNQQPGNGAVNFVNDGDASTYWYAGENRAHGRISIHFKSPCRVNEIRMLGSSTERHAPKDYSVGLITVDGARNEVASISDEKRIGEWIKFPVAGLEAKGIYLDVRSTVEGKHGPVIYELQAIGQSCSTEPYPSEVIIPLRGASAEEVFFLGNVGDGFETTPDTETPVGEYVLRYTDGREEVVPLVAGRNVASYRYGHFVPQAEFAFGFRDPDAVFSDPPGTLHYHLDEMLPVSARRQLMMFSYEPKRRGTPLESLTFRCTNENGSLFLAGLTLRQSGPRMNALVYKGRVVRPYPKETAKAQPSPINALIDKSRVLSLDGEWQYATDPGNCGIRREYYSPDFDATNWKKMPVPSQWYVHGLDYHGVVWFRKYFDVAKTFPGEVLELNFGGVDYDARVWVNGDYIGRHVGAFASFKLDATKAIRKGAKNLVVVRVDSPIDPGYSPQKTIIKGNSQDDICMPYNQEGCSGGIFRSVTLVGRGKIGVENVWTNTVVRHDLKHADITVRFELNPAPDVHGTATVKCRLSEPGAQGKKARVFTSEKTVDINGRIPVDLSLAIDEPLLWFPWEQGTPHLHTLEVEVRKGDDLLDKHVSRVGLRQVTLNRKEKCVYINHHRIFIKGMLNDDIHWMSMMDRTGYRHRIQLQKDANLNLIRMIGHQSSPDMYDLCDEMGMMIWQEMPLQWGYSTDEPVRDDIIDVVAETVRQCRSHASVIGWSGWNEGGQPGFSERITDTIEGLDGTRPVSQACGYGDFDVHIYPNITPAQLSRRTFFWTGIKLEFVSEVGAYGLSSMDEISEFMGDDLLPFDSADYYWETFCSYRYNDGPVFWDSPFNAYWPTEKVKEYILNKIEPSERWLSQFMKFMFENFRAQKFDPTTAAIHCRFDDPMPTAYLGIVNFNGRPRKAYYSVKQACQQVLPIIFFDFEGAADVRVVNDYWNREWRGCTLKYKLTDRSGKTLNEIRRRFDLPADSTVRVLKREEVGDIYHVPGGFYAELAVLDKDGNVLSKNHYDLTGDEIEAFVTSVYPFPPVKPINSVCVTADRIVSSGEPGIIADANGTYSPVLAKLGGDSGRNALQFSVDLPEDGAYLIRVACNSGADLRQYELLVDDVKSDLENYPYTDMNIGMTRINYVDGVAGFTYSSHNLAWYPGWSVKVQRGVHRVEIRWSKDQPAPMLLVDAVCLQHCLNPDTRGYGTGSGYTADKSTTDNKNLK